MGGRQSNLLDAATSDNALAVKKLLDDEATDPSVCDPNGWTALHIASFQGHIAVVHEVLSSRHARALVNLPDKKGRTPLHLAASQDHAEVAASLLAAGSSGDARDANKLLSIHKAAYAGAASVLKLLARQRMHVNDSLHDGMTPLHMASWQGSVECINVLLAAGADPLARNNRGGTPLHEAADAGHLLAVRALLAGPSRGAMNLRALGGMRPVDLAAAKGHERVVRELKRAEDGGLLSMIGKTVGRTIGLLKEVGAHSRGGGGGEADDGADDWGEVARARDWDGALISPPALLAPSVSCEVSSLPHSPSARSPCPIWWVTGFCFWDLDLNPVSGAVSSLPNSPSAPLPTPALLPPPDTRSQRPWVPE